MNVFSIKLLAVSGMLLSHLGIFFFPEHAILRIIGTIAFPLFAWLIANGARHTRNIYAYEARLLAFAALSQLPFAAANGILGTPFEYLNVFFTLFLGLVAVTRFERWKSSFARFAAVVACAVAAQYFNTDYGAAGVLSIVAFHVFFNRFWLMAISQVVILGILPTFTYLIGLYEPAVASLYASYHFQWASLAALPVISLYNGERGYPLQWLFYAIYPIHYLVIFLVQVALSV